MVKNRTFSERFAEVCGTSKPADIQRLLSISYQAAKNYLNGRLPSSEVLLTIADRTPYSIDWLLTGRGKKIVSDEVVEDTPIGSRQMEKFVRKVCVEVINEMTTINPAGQSKIVILPSSEILSETAAEDAVIPAKHFD